MEIIYAIVITLIVTATVTYLATDWKLKKEISKKEKVQIQSHIEFLDFVLDCKDCVEFDESIRLRKEALKSLI